MVCGRWATLQWHDVHPLNMHLERTTTCTQHVHVQPHYNLHVLVHLHSIVHMYMYIMYMYTMYTVYLNKVHNYTVCKNNVRKVENIPLSLAVELSSLILNTVNPHLLLTAWVRDQLSLFQQGNLSHWLLPHQHSYPAHPDSLARPLVLSHQFSETGKQAGEKGVDSE